LFHPRELLYIEVYLLKYLLFVVQPMLNFYDEDIFLIHVIFNHSFSYLKASC